MKRLPVTFALVVLVLGIAAAVWHWHAGELATLQQGQARAAQTLLDSGTRDPGLLVRALARQGLHVVVQSTQGDRLFDSDGDRIDVAPRPPFGGEPPPGAAPPGAAQPPMRAGPIAQIAGSLYGVAPERIERDGLTISIGPNIRQLATWLEIEALVVVLSVALVASLFVWNAVSAANAERAKLKAVADERHAAAVEFQRFLADAGHELRTPLTIVSGYVDILSADADESDERMRRLFQGMKAETARMRALVEKMLLLARLETPVAVPKLIDLASIAHDAATAMLATFPGRTIAIENVGAAHIVIDQDDLYEALHNLIENALKYAPDSSIHLRTGVAEHRAFATVSDRGPGIPANERERIFNRFYRGNGRSDSDGSGLGLAIVSRVAERWNGTIELESRPGATSFTLSFPVADEEVHVATR